MKDKTKPTNKQYTKHLKTSIGLQQSNFSNHVQNFSYDPVLQILRIVEMPKKGSDYFASWGQSTAASSLFSSNCLWLKAK